ncbi:unnamed protein product [Closterium sp. Naga37s-1]|nr:unnamed protein product [Closterium sp. Naga37s-1]
MLRPNPTSAQTTLKPLRSSLLHWGQSAGMKGGGTGEGDRGGGRGEYWGGEWGELEQAIQGGKRGKGSSSGHLWGTGRSGSRSSSSGGGGQKVYLLRCTEGHVDPAVVHTGIATPTTDMYMWGFNLPSSTLRSPVWTAAATADHSSPACWTVAATTAHSSPACWIAAATAAHSSPACWTAAATAAHPPAPSLSAHPPASVGVMLLQLLTGWAGAVDGQRTHIYRWVRERGSASQAQQHLTAGDISPLMDPLLPQPLPPPALILPLFRLALACSSPSPSALPTPSSALTTLRPLRSSLLL